MATSISIPRTPRSLQEISSGLAIDGNIKKRAVPSTAELRADDESLRVKTSKALIFKSDTARTDHRKQARAIVLAGLQQSLRDSFPRAETRELSTAVALATDHLGIPKPGDAFTVGHLRMLCTYAQRISGLAKQCRLPLPLAQEVVNHFDIGLRGGEAGDLYSHAIMVQVGNLLALDRGMSVDAAHRAVTGRGAAPEDNKARKPVQQAALAARDSRVRGSEPQPATAHRSAEPALEWDWEQPGSRRTPEDIAASYMGSKDLQELKPQRRWQLLNLVSRLVPECFGDAHLFQKVVVQAAKAMTPNTALDPRRALADRADPAKRQTILAFDLGDIGAMPKAAPVPSDRDQAFLQAMNSKAIPEQ